MGAIAAGGRPEPRQAAPVFTNPMKITNKYLPLSSLRRDVLEGMEGGRKIRVERTMKPGTREFELHGKKIQTSIMEDREFEAGKLKEVTLDYFAQADDGTVYYFGEKVDMYRNGKVIGHEGAWLTGEHNARPGVLFPGKPELGVRFQSEAVPGIAEESDEVIALDETVTEPAGTFKHCIKIKELVPGEKPEYKYYAPGVGVVREVPSGGDIKLVSHKTREN
jgi:hypothetical protein